MQKFMERPFYTRIALAGVATYLALAALIGVPILIFSPSDFVFPLIIAIIALVVGAVVYFVRPWGLILAVIGGLFGLLFSSDGIDLALGSPQAFFDFAFPLFTLTGAIFMLIGGITGLVQHFRRQESTGNPTLVMAMKGLYGVIGVLLVISAVLTIANLGGASAEEKEGAAVVEAKDTEFEPTALTSSPTGKIVIENNDPVLHTFTIDALDIDVKVGPGSHEVYTLESVAAGQYAFYCRVVGHESMDGVLTVR